MFESHDIGTAEPAERPDHWVNLSPSSCGNVIRRKNASCLSENLFSMAISNPP